MDKISKTVRQRKGEISSSTADVSIVGTPENGMNSDIDVKISKNNVNDIKNNRNNVNNSTKSIHNDGSTKKRTIKKIEKNDSKFRKYIILLFITIGVCIHFFAPSDPKILYESPSRFPVQELLRRYLMGTTSLVDFAHPDKFLNLTQPGSFIHISTIQVLNRNPPICLEGENDDFCYFEDKAARQEHSTYTRRTFYYQKREKNILDINRATPNNLNVKKQPFHDIIWLEGWLFQPIQNDSQTPITIMGHGLGAQKDISLEEFAIEFVNQKVAAFAFDYRTWGGSGGYPRHLAVPTHFVEDYMTTVRFIVEGNISSSIDNTEIVLWGTSYSGGHVLAAYPKIKQNTPKFAKHIKGIISLVPFIDGRQTVINMFTGQNMLRNLRMMSVFIPDLIRSIVYNPAIIPGISKDPCLTSSTDSLVSSFLCGSLYVKIGAPHGELAMLQLTDQDYDKWEYKANISHQHAKALNPDGGLLGGWTNAIVARSLAFVGTYRPIETVDEIDVPTLFMATGKDNLCPIELIQTAIDKINKNTKNHNNRELAESVVYQNLGHFDLYTDQYRSEVVARMATFIETL